MDHRRDAWQNTISGDNDQSNIDPTQEEEKAEISYRRSTAGDSVLFEEFKTISVLGRGTFAKVYLIYLPIDFGNKFYALKSMRKDVILENNSVTSISLEKMIML